MNLLSLSRPGHDAFWLNISQEKKYPVKKHYVRGTIYKKLHLKTYKLGSFIRYGFLPFLSLISHTTFRLTENIKNFQVLPVPD